MKNTIIYVIGTVPLTTVASLALAIALNQKIMLPLSKPALSALTIFMFMNIWNDYLGPLIYLKTETKKTIQLGLKMFIGQYSSEYGLIMAGSVVSAIIVFLCLQKYFVEGVASTGLKG